MSNPTGDWAKLSEMVEADEEAGLANRRGEKASQDSTAAIAMVHLRELARMSEEAAVVLEAAGYQTLPGELLKVSVRLVEIREALERLTGDAR